MNDTSKTCDFNHLILYAKGWYKKTDFLDDVRKILAHRSEVIYKNGWFSIRSHGSASHKYAAKRSLAEFMATIDRVEKTEPYTEHPPLSPINPRNSLPKLTEPVFHKRKELRKLRNEIKQLCPYMTQDEVLEWAKTYTISTLDLIYLILDMDTKS